MQHHKQLVLFFSVALTSLMLGGIATGYYIANQHRNNLSSPDFLQKRLSEVSPPNEKKGTERPPALVRVDVAKREIIGDVRAFLGRLVAVQIAKISTEVAGLVVALPVEVGQRVTGGETLIAQIDNTWINLTISQTEAEIAILEKQLEYQSSENARLETLAVSRAITESELNNQRTLLEQVRRNLEKAVISNKEAKEKLKRTSILAPFDGYIVKRETGLGELLAPGTPIAEIVSLGYVDAYVYVVEDYINRIKIGDEIPILIDRLGINVVGKVHSVVPYSSTAMRSFPILVRLADRDGELKVGMAATAMVSTSDPKEQIVVSKDAVLMKPDGNIVWVAAKEMEEADKSAEKYVAKPVPVKITARSLDIFGIEPETDEGKMLLVSGANVVIEGAERLMPNQPIRIIGISKSVTENLPPATGHNVLRD